MASPRNPSPTPSTTNNRHSLNSADGITAPAELSAVVDDLLNQLSNKFAGVSSEIFAKMDEMSRRLDNLEATLQSNAVAESKSGSSPTKK